jgi:hypothetical protein
MDEQNRSKPCNSLQPGSDICGPVRDSDSEKTNAMVSNRLAAHDAAQAP